MTVHCTLPPPPLSSLLCRVAPVASVAACLSVCLARSLAVSGCLCLGHVARCVPAAVAIVNCNFLLHNFCHYPGMTLVCCCSGPGQAKPVRAVVVNPRPVAIFVMTSIHFDCRRLTDIRPLPLPFSAACPAYIRIRLFILCQHPLSSTFHHFLSLLPLPLLLRRRLLCARLFTAFSAV